MGPTTFLQGSSVKQTDPFPANKAEFGKHHRVAGLKACLFVGGELGATDICLNQFAILENEKQAGGIMLQMII